MNGVRRTVAGGYVLLAAPPGASATREVGFRLAAYDTSKPLVIDPVLLYSTYLGGSGEDFANGIAVDGQGNAYVTGTTTSPNFPGAGTGAAGEIPSTLDPRASFDVFVTKLEVDPTTFALSVSYSTYLGGSDTDVGNAIAVDADRNVYVTGTTESDAVTEGFPATFGAFDTTCGTDGFCDDAAVDGQDAFVAKLDPTGALVYCAYLGGSREAESGNGIAVDADRNAYVTGNTISPDFPGAGPDFPGAGVPIAPKIGGSPPGTGMEIFVTKVNPAGSALVYSTYIGGDDFQFGWDIAVSADGYAYVTGSTLSTADTFPITENAFQSVKAAGRDGFVARLNLAGTALLYMTYLGGSQQENPNAAAIAVDGAGMIYVTGTTDSTNFPAPAAAPKLGPGLKGASDDAFVVKLDPSQSGAMSLVYSTYVGGSGQDIGLGIAVDNQGNAYVTGKTNSTDFPGTTGPPSGAPKFGEGQFGQFGDVFVAKLNTTGDQLLYSTYIGGTATETGRGIALDPSCNAYVTGVTDSFDFPRTNPLPTELDATTNVGVGGDAFVTKLAQFGFPAYITNLDAGSVSVIDTHTNAVGDPIPLGANPEGVAVHPDGTRVYVANSGSSSVSVIDTATNTVIKTVSLGVNLNPVGVAITKDGHRVYVANSGVDPAKTTHTISVIDTATDFDPSVTGVQQVELAIAPGDAGALPKLNPTDPDVRQANVPFGIAVSPDLEGTRVYVTNRLANENDNPFVTVIDVNTTTTPPTHTFVTQVPVGDSPAGVAVSPDGTRVYVANASSDRVSVIDTASNLNFFNVDVGGGTFGVAVHPSGSKVYVTGPGKNLSVLEISWDPGIPPHLIAQVEVGNLPRGVAVTPDGAFVYVANYADSTVSVINTANNKRIDFDTTTAFPIDDLPLGTGSGPVALGQFIGVPVFDKDGDGIQDLVDGAVLSGSFVPAIDPVNKNNTFTNQHLCGTTFGFIGPAPVPDGMAVFVASPAGIVIGAAGFNGIPAEVTVCGDFKALYTPGDVMAVNGCGSLAAQVLSGPVEIVLKGDGVLTVQSGVTFRVAETGPDLFTVQFQGRTITLGSGDSATLSSDGSVVEHVPPDIQCNAPATITPPGVPVSFRATATDNAGPATAQITAVTCSLVNPTGKRVDKSGACQAAIVNGDTLTITDSGGVGDVIAWSVSATDAGGNTASRTCQVQVVNPGKGGGKARAGK